MCGICLFSNSSNKAVLAWSRSFLAKDKMSRGMNLFVIQFIIQIDIWPTHIMSVVILLEEKGSALREIYTTMLFDWYIISSYLYSWSLQKQRVITATCLKKVHRHTFVFYFGISTELNNMHVITIVNMICMYVELFVFCYDQRAYIDQHSKFSSIYL